MNNEFVFKLTGDPSQLVNALKSIETQAKKVGDSIDASVNLDGSKGVKSFDNLIGKFKEGQATASQGGGIFGNIAGTLGQLASPAGAATAAIGVLAVGFKSLVSSALEYDEIGDKLELSFSQAGLSGKQLADQIDRTSANARNMALKFAAPVDTFKELSAAASALGGATGQMNDDLVSVGFGIEKATDGMIKGEAAIRLFSQGVADPENAANVEKLAKKFPALGEALKKPGDAATKVQAALKALNPTLTTLASQAGDAGSTFERFKIIGGEALKTFAGTIYDKISAGLSGIADTLGSINFEGIINGAKVLGSIIGDVVVSAFNVLKKVFSGLQNAISPLIDAIGSLFSGGGDSAESFADTIGQAFGLVSDVIGSFYEIVISSFKPFISLIGEAVKFLFNFGGASDSAGKSTSSFKEKIMGVRAVVAGVTTAIKEVINIISELATSLVHFDFGKFTSLISGSADRVAKSYSDAKDSAFNSLQETAKAEKELADKKEKSAKNLIETAKNLQATYDTLADTQKKQQLGALKKELSVQIKSQLITSDDAKQVEDILKQLSAKAGKDKTAVDLAKDEFAAKQKSLEAELKIFEAKVKEEAIAKGQSELSAKQLKQIDAKRLEIAERTTQEFDNLYKVTKSADGQIQIGIKLDAKTKQSADEELLAFRAGITDKTADIKLHINKDSAEETKKEFEKLVSDLKEQASESISKAKDLFNVEITPTLSRDTFNASVDAALRDLERQRTVLNVAISSTADEKTKADLQKQVSELSKAELELKTKGADKINKLLLDRDNQRREVEISLIKDKNQREIAEKIFSLEKQRDIEVDKAKQVGADSLAVAARYDEEIAKLRGQGAVSVRDKYVDTVRDISKLYKDNFATLSKFIVDNLGSAADSFADKAVSKVNLITDAYAQQLALLQGQNDERKKANEEALKGDTSEKDTLSLQKQLAKRKISIEEYTQAINDIESKKSEKTVSIQSDEDLQVLALQKAANDTLTKVIQDSFAKQAQAIQDFTAFRALSETDKIKQVESTQAQISAIEAIEFSKRTQQQQDQLARLNEQMNNIGKSTVDVMKDIGIGAAAGFGEMVLAGKSATDALKETAIQTIKSLVSLYIAPIIASALSFLGPFGLPVAMGLVGLINQTLAGAISKFAGGVIDMNGRGTGTSDSNLALLSRGESVMRADITKRERPLLKYLHEGGSSKDFFQKNYSAVITPSGELQYQTLNQLAQVNRRLERVESAIVTSGSFREVNMKVEHDESLIFKSRDRFTKIRNARY